MQVDLYNGCKMVVVDVAVPEGSTLIFLDVPKFPYKTVWDRWKEASMPKTARFFGSFGYNAGL